MLLWSLVGALGAPSSGWPTFETDCGPQLFQTHMGRHKQTRQTQLGGWQQHAYFVGASHKTGTEMLHNIMRRAFDILGGMDSCNYAGGGGPLTSKAPRHQDCHLHPARIRFTHHTSGDDVRELRGLTAGAGGFRGVMMIRDPLDMIVSSYVYHHRGAEATTELGVNMTEMNPERGIPEMANRMFDVISTMVDAYKVRKPDMMAVRFETITSSSQSFNRTVQEIVRFMFRDEITEKQRQAILDDAVNEDLNRGDENGLAFQEHPRERPDAVNAFNHTNDDEEMVETRKYLPLVKPHIYAEILRQRVLCVSHLGGCAGMGTLEISAVFLFLGNRGYECLQAPYFAGAQLAHFAEQGVVQTIFGPPGLLLYGVKSVVIHLNFSQQAFDWVDLGRVLDKWQLSWDEFVDACMLAGTEYCLTYPYLNLSTFQPQQKLWQQAPRFNFDAAVYIIKQAPLINWMQTFPTDEMRTDHVEGYCICKVLVQNSPVLHLQDHAIRPLGACKPGGTPPAVPQDFSSIMGQKLPPRLYYLMLHGIISHKLPQALAKGEWTDKSQPLVDTHEFRSLLADLQEYRQVALGLVAQHLHRSFHQKKILCAAASKAFWEPSAIRQAFGSDASLPPEARVIQPAIVQGLRWRISGSAVKAEMQRQGVSKVDFSFCLNWHSHEFESDGPLMQGITDQGAPSFDGDLLSLTLGDAAEGTCADSVVCDHHAHPIQRLVKTSDAMYLRNALVHFIVLEKLDLISNEEKLLHFENTPSVLTEPCLTALELMKFGQLTGDPFEVAESSKPFPQEIKYPSSSTLAASDRDKVCGTLLLCRVMSLVPMRLKNVMWDSDVDFDLAAFHALVRALKRTLRQLVEGALAHVLLPDLQRVKILPKGFMSATPLKDSYPNTPAELPTFMLPRACMGILVRYFLEYQGTAESFKTDVTKRFPCCAQAIEDLQLAFTFWQDLKRCVDTVADPLGAEDLSEDMRKASEILQSQRQKLGI
ncbi:unnamed protein product [Durusdinium trenchii]|uniref:Sulfotransferase n=1 Tax=Durusdinium trenchii TaxID=1381693 RepID=A0ABP0IVQ1_9DINO